MKTVNRETLKEIKQGAINLTPAAKWEIKKLIGVIKGTHIIIKKPKFRSHHGINKDGKKY